jgi:hypothetical protein
MEKSGLRYSFERMYGWEEKYQVRLNGQFIMCTHEKDSKVVDEILQDEGYTSRQEVLDYLNEESMKRI